MTQYPTIFDEHLKRYGELAAEEQRIQSQKEKIFEMLKSSIALMSEEETRKYADLFMAVLEQEKKNDMGITESIRTLLQMHPKAWFNAVKVKDSLKASGFSFEGYTANPLASIHAVLKRFKRTEVVVRKSAEGLKEYRWIGPNLPTGFRVTTTIINQK